MDEFRARLDSAIDEFSTASQNFKKSPSPDTAEQASLASCDAVQLFFFVRGDFGNDATSKIDRLQNALDDTENALKILADDNGEESVFSQYLENVQRRKNLVDAVIADDVVEIKRILKLTTQTP